MQEQFSIIAAPGIPAYRGIQYILYILYIAAPGIPAYRGIQYILYINEKMGTRPTFDPWLKIAQAVK